MEKIWKEHQKKEYVEAKVLELKYKTVVLNGAVSNLSDPADTWVHLVNTFHNLVIVNCVESC